MILTKKDLREYQENMRVFIPDNLAKELLERYGTYATDEEGHVFEYTEQDIYEQIRKILRDKGYEKM
jgi:hypothetical protein